MAVATSGAFPVAEKAAIEIIKESGNPIRELNSAVILEMWLQTRTVYINGLYNCRFKSQNQTLSRYFPIDEGAARFSDTC